MNKPDMGAFYVRLVALEDGIVPYTHGNKIHGAFFGIMNRFAPDVAAAIHKGYEKQERPFTLSPLVKERLSFSAPKKIPATYNASLSIMKERMVFSRHRHRAAHDRCNGGVFQSRGGNVAVDKMKFGIADIEHCGKGRETRPDQPMPGFGSSAITKKIKKNNRLLACISLPLPHSAEKA